MITATIVAVAACLVVLFSTAISVRVTFRRPAHHNQTRGYRQVSGRLEDEALDHEEEEPVSTTDGELTLSPYLRLTLGIAAVIASIFALLALSSTVQGTDPGLDPKRCLHLAAQALVTFQSVLFLRGRSMRKRFLIGICIAVSSLAILGSLAFLHYRIASRGFKTSVLPDVIHTIACCIVGTTALAVPQRAIVYHNGQVVDGQHTVSAIEK